MHEGSSRLKSKIDAMMAGIWTLRRRKYEDTAECGWMTVFSEPRGYVIGNSTVWALPAKSRDGRDITGPSGKTRAETILKFRIENPDSPLYEFSNPAGEAGSLERLARQMKEIDA